MPTDTPAFEAVVFDLGGVVLGSPLHAIRDFETEHDVPTNTINHHVVRSAPDGAWHRLERGELALGNDFYRAFDTELAALGHPLSSERMMARIAEVSKPRPEMLAAIDGLRESSFKVAALTNNWTDHDRDRGNVYRDTGLVDRFDLFLESAVLGMRKPDPRIYRHTAAELGVPLEHIVFLDDIGSNLKSARELGMHTIKVDDPRTALDELRAVLDLDQDWRRR